MVKAVRVVRLASPKGRPGGVRSGEEHTPFTPAVKSEGDIIGDTADKRRTHWVTLTFDLVFC